MPLFSTALLISFDVYPQLALWATKMAQSLIAKLVLLSNPVR
jgi:hypothetical protein